MREKTYLPASDDIPTIEPHEVCTKFPNLKSNNVAGADLDNLHPRILKVFAYELAVPVATIFNKSLLTAVMPSM